jgi:hypothetical protein
MFRIAYQSTAPARRTRKQPPSGAVQVTAFDMHTPPFDTLEAAQQAAAQRSGLDGARVVVLDSDTGWRVARPAPAAPAAGQPDAALLDVLDAAAAELPRLPVPGAHELARMAREGAAAARTGHLPTRAVLARVRRFVQALDRCGADAVLPLLVRADDAVRSCHAAA